MWIADGWEDYELLDCGGGEKLERWGKQILVRPDPQAIWETPRTNRGWRNAQGRYYRSSSGGGHWDKEKLPESWTVNYKDLKFQVKPMNFKHTGLFPEQAVNWDFAREKIKNAGRPIRVLNLFAYTGGATVACAAAGAQVCHVDAAKGMVNWARENARVSGLSDAPVRWIIDDCAKFVEREIRRGKVYDAIIMDPPSYGRGPGGEVWKLEDNLFPFVKLCAQVLSDKPLFVIINSYTTGLAPSVLGYMLHLLVAEKYGGKVYVEGMDTMDESLLLEIRRRVGMVFQNPDNQIVANVVEEDVAFAPENLGVPSAEIRKRVDDALEAVGMTQFVKHAPHLLSGGQKQRIAIAGVLAMKPECIVLDEATAMLDPIGRREVLAAVEKLNREQGITVVLITHHMNEAEHADRVIVMNDGLVVMDGKPREVFTRKKELENIGLAVPDTVSLLFSLREAGMDVPVDAITVEECADVIAKNFT